jgi:hypothetical protein
MHEEIRGTSATIDVDDESFEIGPCRVETGQAFDGNAAGRDRIGASRDEIDGRRTIHSQAIYELRLLGAFGASSLLVFLSSLKMKKRTKE